MPAIHLKKTVQYNLKHLLHRVAQDDEDAFKVIFDAYKERFYAVALKMTRSHAIAEEIVQETFIKIWQKRFSLGDIENADAYFFTAIYRRIYNYYKKLALEQKLLDHIATLPASKNITDETVLAWESERFINDAIKSLPAQQQLVFRLSKQDGLSREQIAEKLQISPNTVRNHLAAAIQSIKAHLNGAAITWSLLLWVTPC